MIPADKALFLAYYIKPFQQATGTDAMVEIMVLLAGPVIWLFTAVFAWWMIGKSYGPSKGSGAR